MDASEGAQMAVIERTFLDVKMDNPSEIRHPDPKKRDLRVVDVGRVMLGKKLNSRHSISCQMPARGRTNTCCSAFQNGLPPPQQRCVVLEKPMADETEPLGRRIFPSPRKGISAPYGAR